MHILHHPEKLSLGARGEKAAANYLKKQGYIIIATNYCNNHGRRLGEIDIIAKDGDEIVFVEVKTRTDNKSTPEENITSSKLYKITKIASFYISKNHLLDATYRFDAITLIADTQKKLARLKHIKNIFL